MELFLLGSLVYSGLRVYIYEIMKNNVRTQMELLITSKYKYTEIKFDIF